MRELEYLLDKKSDVISERKYTKYGDIKGGINDNGAQLTADKSATLFDFIKMIDKVVELTMGDKGVTFIPDEGTSQYLSNDMPIDKAVISYKLIDRSPKGELKPRVRQAFNDIDPSGNKISGEIYGQKFKCHLQFNIAASVYTKAEEVMSMFEDAMFTYAGFFKKNGVAELLFDKQLTDGDFTLARQSLSIRNLRYYVEIEKLTVIVRENIKAIETF